MRVPAEIAAEIATTIGQPYGVVNSDLVGRSGDADGASMESYVCVLRAYAFRRSFEFAELGPVRECLERAVRRDPTYADAWAMLGWIHVDEGRIDYLGTGDRDAAYEKALQATTRAYALDPENTRALKALAAVNHYLGRFALSERLARRALALNPNDPETMAQLGWRLVIRGKSEEGVALLKQAIERTLNPPSWYFHLVAIDLHLRGDHAEMRKVAERAALNDRGVGQGLLAIACAEQGDVACTRRALEQMAQARPFARDPEGFLRRHGAIDEVVEALMAGLEKARRLTSGPGLAAPAGSATPVSLPIIEN
jgi:tetratricopeptide (TPR) repeat protein